MASALPPTKSIPSSASGGRPSALRCGGAPKPWKNLLSESQHTTHASSPWLGFPGAPSYPPTQGDPSPPTGPVYPWIRNAPFPKFHSQERPWGLCWPGARGGSGMPCDAEDDGPASPPKIELNSPPRKLLSSRRPAPTPAAGVPSGRWGIGGGGACPGRVGGAGGSSCRGSGLTWSSSWVKISFSCYLTISINSELHEAQCGTPSTWTERGGSGQSTINGLVCAPHWD